MIIFLVLSLLANIFLVVFLVEARDTVKIEESMHSSTRLMLDMERKDKKNWLDLYPPLAHYKPSPIISKKSPRKKKK